MIGTLGKPAPADDPAAIKRAAAGLEEALLRQMLQTMAHAQLEGGGFFGSGSAEGTEQTTFEMLLSQTLAEDTPLGLAGQIAEQYARQGTGTRDLEHRVRELAAPALAELPLGGAAVPDGNMAAVYRNHTPGPQGHGNRSEEKGGNPRTGR